MQMNTLDWTPIRWPAEWRHPDHLRLLDGTPFNCLILDGPASVVQSLVDAARARNLEVVDPSDTRVIWLSGSDVSRRSSAPVRAFTGCVWPSVKLSGSGEQSAVDAGPTGIPWIDSNGWFVRLAKTMAPEQAVWIVANPPEKTMIPAEAYGVAVADAAACGGRWVVSLDKGFRQELAKREQSALLRWQNVGSSLAFFERHREWRAWRPAGVLAVVSDFRGPNEFLSTEVLNLLFRRGIPVRIFDKARPDVWAWQGLKSVLYVDQAPPAPKVWQRLLAFARAGGRLTLAVHCARLVPWTQPLRDEHPRFRIFQSEKGQISVAKKEFEDPYLLAADVQALLSASNDLIRTWNASSAIFHCADAPRGGRVVVQIVGYAHRPMEFITLAVRGRWRSARFWTIGSDTPVHLGSTAVAGMSEFHLPPVPSYAALELEEA